MHVYVFVILSVANTHCLLLLFLFLIFAEINTLVYQQKKFKYNLRLIRIHRKSFQMDRQGVEFENVVRRAAAERDISVL